jgi:hypothetical protein
MGHVAAEIDPRWGATRTAPNPAVKAVVLPWPKPPGVCAERNPQRCSLAVAQRRRRRFWREIGGMDGRPNLRSGPAAMRYCPRRSIKRQRLAAGPLPASFGPRLLEDKNDV